MVVGVVLIAGSVVAGLGPIALVCGALLLWSGIVKAIVLRIWRTTLSSGFCTRSASDTIGNSGTAIGQRT